MEYNDLDEEGKAKRKKEQVEFRNKRRLSRKFTILASLFEIVETLIIIFGLIILAAILAFSVFKIEEGSVGVNIFQISLIFIFIGGMVLGFIIYKKCVRFAIKKFKLMDKLEEGILIHYFKDEELNIEDGRLK